MGEAMADTTNRLGEFLRARRALVTPEEVGLPDVGRRRVAGLRREELALLAGVSVDYYVRLEQGRDTHPSTQVLDALARALRLDDDAVAHLHDLARPAPRRRRPRARPERVRPGVLRLLESWSSIPAFVLGRRMDVLAYNALAGLLHGDFATERNIVRVVFLDPSARETYPDWDAVAHETVATLRAAAGADLDDPALTELVGELSLKSEAFRRLWARHDVREKASGVKRFVHPMVGELELGYESFAINDSPGQLLVAYHAEPGSPSERALALLAGIAAGEAVTAPRHSDPAAW
jgi:transcriptional regulator with XRE-family HTH domain